MAAQAWKFYRTGRKYLATGDIDLDGDVFYIALHKSTSNAATETLSTQGELTNEINASWGYTAGGKTLSNTSWTSVATDKYMFNGDDVFWSANGGTITSARFAVLYESGGKLIAYASLTSGTSGASVKDTNRLTLIIDSGGVFDLSGA